MDISGLDMIVKKKKVPDKLHSNDRDFRNYSTLTITSHVSCSGKLLVELITKPSDFSHVRKIIRGPTFLPSRNFYHHAMKRVFVYNFTEFFSSLFFHRDCRWLSLNFSGQFWNSSGDISRVSRMWLVWQYMANENFTYTFFTQVISFNFITGFCNFI